MSWDRLVHGQAAGVRALEAIMEAGRKAKVEPIRWRIDERGTSIVGEVALHTYENEKRDWTQAQRDADTRRRNEAAYDGWTQVILGLLAASVDNVGQGSVPTKINVWDPRTDEHGDTRVRTFADSVSVHVGRGRCAWLLSLGVMGTIAAAADPETATAP